MDFLSQTILHNTVRTWLLAIAWGAIAYATLTFALSRVRKLATRMHALTGNFAGQLTLQLLPATRRWALLGWSIVIALHSVRLPPAAPPILRRALFVVTLLQIALWGSEAIRFAIDRQIRLKSQQDASVVATLGLMRFLITAAFYALLLLLTLNNLGVDITALVAGLGVGGIAIALAVQNILGDLFASLTIVLDKPFVVGDSINVGGDIGTVERIGLKTTRLRSVSGEQLIFPNSDLLRSRIRNYKRMNERRAVFNLGVTYQTPSALRSRIPQLVREVIESQPLARFERCRLRSLGASSLDFETSYWCEDPDFERASEVLERIQLGILDAFEREGIEFAYPTQTVHLNR